MEGEREAEPEKTGSLAWDWGGEEGLPSRSAFPPGYSSVLQAATFSFFALQVLLMAEGLQSAHLFIIFLHGWG